eukprot:2267759-Prymnesium_polylepis.1
MLAQRRERRATARYEPYSAPPKRSNADTAPSEPKQPTRRSSKRPALLRLDNNNVVESRAPAPEKSASTALIVCEKSRALVPYEPSRGKQRLGGRFAAMLQKSAAVAEAEKAQSNVAAVAPRAPPREQSSCILALPPPRATDAANETSHRPLLLNGPAAARKKQPSAQQRAGSTRIQKGKRGGQPSKRRGGASSAAGATARGGAVRRGRSGGLALTISNGSPERTARRTRSTALIGPLSDDEGEDEAAEGALVAAAPDRLGMLQRLGKGPARWSGSPLPDDRAQACTALLRRLANHLRQCGGKGALTKGWKVQYRTSRSIGTYGQHAVTYIAPTGRKMTSKAEVAWYLGLSAALPCAPLQATATDCAAA